MVTELGNPSNARSRRRRERHPERSRFNILLGPKARQSHAGISEPGELPSKKAQFPLLIGRALPALQIEHDGKDGRPVTKPKQGRVPERASREILLGPRLDLDVNQDEFQLPLVGLEPGDDVDFPGRALGKIREELFVEKDQRPKVKPSRHLRKKQLQEVPKELLQERLKELVVSQRLPSKKEDEFESAYPPLVCKPRTCSRL